MKSLLELLQALGLDEQEQRVFIFLHQNGPCSILRLSRGTRINRTTLYRVCDALERSEYIQKVSATNALQYEAVSIGSLYTKIQDIENRAQVLKERYDLVKEDINSKTNSKTNEMFLQYKGVGEVQQLVWNVLSARSGDVSFGHRLTFKILGFEYMNKWWEKYMSKYRESRVIVNDESLGLVRSSYQRLFDLHAGSSGVRSIPERVYTIHEHIFVYDDVFAVIRFDKQEVSGYEVHDVLHAGQQKQLFDMVWEQGRSIKV